jgi:hypothetical protein
MHSTERQIVSLFNFSKRRWLIAFLMVFMTTGSGVAYSLWNRQFIDIEDPTIDIGVGTVIEVSETLNPPPGTKLIPYGAFKGANDIDEYTFVYTVRLNKIGRLVVTVNSVTVGGEANPYNIIEVGVGSENNLLLNEPVYRITFEPEEGTEFYVATIYVTVRLSQNATFDQYLEIQGKSISLKIEFKAEALIA